MTRTTRNVTLKLEISEAVWQELEEVARIHRDYNTVEEIAQRMLVCAAEGAVRPGCWEAAWLSQVLGPFRH